MRPVAVVAVPVCTQQPDSALLCGPCWARLSHCALPGDAVFALPGDTGGRSSFPTFVATATVFCEARLGGFAHFYVNLSFY